MAARSQQREALRIQKKEQTNSILRLVSLTTVRITFDENDNNHL